MQFWYITPMAIALKYIYFQSHYYSVHEVSKCLNTPVLIIAEKVSSYENLIPLSLLQFYEDSLKVWNHYLCKVFALNPAKHFMAPFYGWGSTASRLQGHYKEVVYFLPLRFQIFLVLIWSTAEEWKAESTPEPPSDFEHDTLGLKSSTDIYEWALNIYQELIDRRRWKNKQKRKAKLFLTEQCLSLRYKVSVLSIYVEGVTQRGSLLPAWII